MYCVYIYIYPRGSWCVEIEFVSNELLGQCSKFNMGLENGAL